MVNGAELHRVNATVHIGHHISTNDNDSLVSAAIGQFWRGFNMFMADFSQIHSHIKCYLFKLQVLLFILWCSIAVHIMVHTMQQLGCESHSVTCVSCYVHVYGNKVIIIIIIVASAKYG